MRRPQVKTYPCLNMASTWYFCNWVYLRITRVEWNHQATYLSFVKIPTVRFIGKRYNGNESICVKWKSWKDNHWFSILENLNSRYANTYIGAKRVVNGSLEYWIGMFFLPNTAVPEGFEYIDIDEINLANFKLQGTAHKATSFETHNLCLAELSKHNMTRFEDHWCFEYYDDKSIDYIGTDKAITMDY